ncbi:hypothetical protein BGZ50_003841 [Haplosporangium sp. Z 11]|nr:hypothetical protein BGZ50_003841 [Haplosporangium sp. Z 11]
MVKLMLSFVAIAAMAATVTTAAPFTLQSMRHFFNPAVHNECIPETTIKEYHPFNLKSWKLNSLVSKEINDNVIVGGVNGDQNLQQLEMCIVSSDYGCNANIPSNCIYENVEYRIRVQEPVQGYLRIAGELIEIVEDFHDASGLNLYKEAGWGLRIARLNYDGSRSVFATNGGGNPLNMEPPRMNDSRQWFQIIEPQLRSRWYRSRRQ